MRADRGVSLFEAVVSIALVSMTAVSAMSAVGAELRTAEKARHVLVAEALATMRLDQLALLTDRELLSLPDTVSSGEFEGDLAEYQWETSSTTSSEQAGIYDVQVRIVWPTGSYAIRSAVYRRPVLAPTR